jgi:hypothetical protein
MENVTKILLKNGINGMIREDEDYFKDNIIHSLSLKLNAAINEASVSLKERLLFSEKITPYRSGIPVLVTFMEHFKPGKYKFEDDTVININESDVKNIKKLFEQLNPNNRLKMAKDIFKNSTSFKQHIEFSKSAKGIL